MSKIDSSEVNLSEEKENYIEISSLREDNHPNLKKIKNINFLENESINDEKNEFKKINSNNTEYPFLVFENCVFKDFEVANYKKELHFINCIFENITLKNRFDNIIFEDCTINDKFIITNYLSLKDQKLSAGNNVIIFNRGSISEFLIYGASNFEHSLYINHNSQNKLEIVNLNISSCIFEKDFSFHNVIIKNAEIKDCDFNSLSEFIDSEFIEKFDFQEITYKGFTLFDDCTFNTKAEFKYIIFEKFTSFRGSKFNKGIDLEYTSSDKEINFYGIEISDKNSTSQETYRIIKNQFEKLNNKIEANKYHALEMEQHRKSIWKSIFNDCNSFLKLLPDGIVLLIHKLSSNHSSDWFLALFWIFVISLITSWSLDSVTVNNFFKYINILLKIEDFNNSYIAMTLNKVSLGYLYYQFLTAVRKDTRK